VLELKNPHSVLAALETRSQDVIEIRLGTVKPHGVWNDVVDAAGQFGVTVRRGTSRQQEGRRRQKHLSQKHERVGNSEATVRENSGVDLDTLFAGVSDAKNAGLWLALDCLQDPHNVGAVFRSAAFFGVRGIVVTRDRSAPLNSTAYDVSCGGFEYVPFSAQTNLSRALESAKECGLWVLGTSEHAEKDVADIERDRPWLVLIGNEEQGLRRLTIQKCDTMCRLAPRGKVTSLNASVAAGILIANLTGDSDGNLNRTGATRPD